MSSIFYYNSSNRSSLSKFETMEEEVEVRHSHFYQIFINAHLNFEMDRDFFKFKVTVMWVMQICLTHVTPFSIYLITLTHFTQSNPMMKKLEQNFFSSSSEPFLWQSQIWIRNECGGRLCKVLHCENKFHFPSTLPSFFLCLL